MLPPLTPPQGALMLSEVLKEREAQVELKQRIQGARQDVDKLLVDMQKQKEQGAAKKEKEAEQQKKLEREAIAQGQRQKYGQIYNIHTGGHNRKIGWDSTTITVLIKFVIFWVIPELADIKFKIIHI